MGKASMKKTNSESKVYNDDNKVRDLVEENAKLRTEKENLLKRLEALEKCVVKPQKKYSNDEFDKLFQSAMMQQKEENPKVIADIKEHPLPCVKICDSKPAIGARNKRVLSSATSTSTSSFTKHKRFRSAGYSCSKCSKVLATSASLALHMKHHAGEKPYQNVNRGSFKCNVCCKVLGRKSSLIVHMRTHTGNKPCQCEICGKQFNDNAQLRRHLMKHTGEKPHLCTVCGKAFTQSGNMLRHMMSHSEERPYQCESCGKGFTRRIKLTDHKCVPGSAPTRIKISRKGPHVCHICNRSFRRSGLLDEHLQRHTGAKPNICNTCGKSFAHPSKLAEHNRIHYGDKPYKCDVCWKSFIKRSYLFEHIKIHSQDKIFQCEICWKSFTKKCYLAKHIRFIHSDSEEIKHNKEQRNINCEQSAVATSMGTSCTAQTYQQQQRPNGFHEVHTCNQCGKSFPKPVGLNKHVRRHHASAVNENMFVSTHMCHICQKTFSRLGYLIAHMVIHTGGKPQSYQSQNLVQRPAISSHINDKAQLYTHHHYDHVTQANVNEDIAGGHVFVNSSDAVTSLNTQPINMTQYSHLQQQHQLLQSHHLLS